MIKVGVYNPDGLPESFRVCITNICSHLQHFDCLPVITDDLSLLKECDVLWDPRAGGGHAPHEPLTELNRPLIVTLHGIGPILYPALYSVGLSHRYQIMKSNRQKKRDWKRLHDKCSKVLTVSEFSKNVICKNISIPKDLVEVIYNGFDKAIFNKNADNDVIINEGQPFFFHISNDEPRKNVDRIIAAYESIPAKDKWPLILKLSSKRTIDVEGIKVIRNRLSDAEVANYYRSAGALVFPSIYEGFGLPIVEALACNCPVITSRNTACEEVGKNAISLVDPFSVKDIAATMKACMEEPQPLLDVDKVIQAYSWLSAAEVHAKHFHNAITLKK
jgi:glycosyltransferase involved in cell wall biosynthesis